jgi:hypothetical protein
MSTVGFLSSYKEEVAVNLIQTLPASQPTKAVASCVIPENSELAL